MILEIQKLASHMTQVIYAGSMLASYFYLDQGKNNQVKNKKFPIAITTCFINFSRYFLMDKKRKLIKMTRTTLPERINLDEFKSQGNQATVSCMSKQYETLVHNNLSSNCEKRTILYFFWPFL